MGKIVHIDTDWDDAVEIHANWDEIKGRFRITANELGVGPINGSTRATVVADSMEAAVVQEKGGKVFFQGEDVPVFVPPRKALH